MNNKRRTESPSLEASVFAVAIIIECIPKTGAGKGKKIENIRNAKLRRSRTPRILNRSKITGHTFGNGFPNVYRDFNNDVGMVHLRRRALMIVIM